MLKVTLGDTGLPSASADHRPVDDLDYDLGNLLAIDPHPAPPSHLPPSTRPHSLATTARDLTQLLVNRLFSLDSTPHPHGGRLVSLPVGTTVLPRSKTMPAEKPATRWERFAKEKGIRKRKHESKKVYDEATGEWKDRYGFKRAEKDGRDWLREAKPGQEGLDLFKLTEQDKKARMDKQAKREKRNVLEGMVALSQKALTHGRVAVPKEEVRRQAAHAHKVAQVSTGSMGKFDREVGGEGKAPVQRGKERTEGMSRASVTSEKAKQLSVLDRLFAKDELVDTDKAVKTHSKELTNRVTKNRAAMGADKMSAKERVRKLGAKKGKSKADGRRGKSGNASRTSASTGGRGSSNPAKRPRKN